MVETIMDLKNNKRKKSSSKSSGAGSDMQQDRLIKFVHNLVRKRGLLDREPLRVTLDDIRNVDSKGKWWLVGAAWTGYDGEGGIGSTTAASSEMADDHFVKVDNAGVDLLQLARAQKMNTDIRRSIFVILMSSEV
jgi:nucleolar MIF4G domain-containing protein 1